ncbi:MAG TPA: CAP domain-containing protein, partial [Planctomycetota bacterium]|nr:CAP domain-containing protein [Planctomycetota bacterium]
WDLVSIEKRKRWEDKANNEQRFRVLKEWRETSQVLARLHRDLGLALVKAENLTRGTYHLERAVHYNPFDKEAHTALGHTEDHGFWGTAEQIAFVNRMKAIETRALELAKQEYKAEALDVATMPEELQRMKLEFHGSKSPHFTVWTRGTQENADNCVKWAERGLDFLAYMIGDEEAKRRNVAARAGSYKWIGFVWTTREREDFLVANPEIWQKDKEGIEGAKHFANVELNSKTGPAMVYMKLTPAQMHDCLIIHAWHNGFGGGLNAGIAEGMYHAATWLLMSTSINKHGALAEGTVSGKELELPESTNWWLRKIRDEALAGEDFQLSLVPKEPLSKFRNDARIKSWSFMTWAMARFPDKWFKWLAKLPETKLAAPPDVENQFEPMFGGNYAQVEGEWRDWARGDSGVAAATGYGPPLLPELPNKEELAALERLNQVRGQAIGYVNAGKNLADGKLILLPTCELDAEASQACEDHAKYLTKWPKEHLKWPEAHEENPALEGFSPRGMRAGMRSVIIWRQGPGSTEFSRDSVDGWIGTVYHRFPLLEHNIKRFGFAFVEDNGYAIGVLDMGSLEEPYDQQQAPKYVAWPPPGMKDAPLKFHGIEFPNPLDDQPESERDITKTGYPVSLQLQREVATKLVSSSISLYTIKTREKPPLQHVVPADAAEGGWAARRKDGAEVPLWVHTPKEPLLKRMEEKEVVFGIPKAHLKPHTAYQVVVVLRTDEGGTQTDIKFCWEFMTGDNDEGLKFTK